MRELLVILVLAASATYFVYEPVYRMVMRCIDVITTLSLPGVL